MPPKAHMKFGDGATAAPSSTDKSTTAGKQNPFSNTYGFKTSSRSSQSNGGKKRARDCSPKISGKGEAQEGLKPESSIAKKQRINGPDSGFSLQKPARVLPNGVMGKTIKGTNHSKAILPNQKAIHRAAEDLKKARAELPIARSKMDIRQKLRRNDVLLLNGETGSGKSTQTPQFLYTEPWCKKQLIKIQNKDGRAEEVAVGGVIAITQPRRVAAITLAQRVAREMGCTLDRSTKQGEVGYAVRFDTVVPRGMKIKFLTEGMLLQEMLNDPYLRQYSAVIVDEIHERSMDVDLISGFLRLLIHGDKRGRGGVPLKVIIMSATLDLGGLKTFFAKPETKPDYEPGKNHDVFRKEAIKSSKKSKEDILSDGKAPARFGKLKGPLANETKSLPPKVELPEESSSEDDEGVAKNGVAYIHVKGRQYTVKTYYDEKPTPDYLDNMLKTVFQLHVAEPLPGDFLCFLTGQDEIETLKIQIEEWALKLNPKLPKIKVMPLYGSLSPDAQQAAFDKVKERYTRKIVLATNIAETSVTVSGVHVVIDCGKSKVKQYRPRLGMESLLNRPISLVSAIQRQGRAGREISGKCVKLYTKEAEEKMEHDEKPEIMRSDVIEAVLKMKARGVDDVLNFPLMDRPDIVAMEKALLQLHVMDAIDDNGILTDAGKKMASYPLPAAYGRVIVEAAKNDCLVEAIDVIACITSDSEIFLQPKSEEDRLEVEEHRKLINHPKGDILTYLTTLRKYVQEEQQNRLDWCKQHMISSRAMKMAVMIRRQLHQTCKSQKILKELPPSDPQPFKEPLPTQEDTLLKTFVKAFVSKTALMGGDGLYVTTLGRNPVYIHPSSVLYGRKLEAVLFLEHVFTMKSYGKKVSAVQANWIEGALLGNRDCEKEPGES
ncbi:P-loop containing nucleoside triphosphate hydrolase protein [Calycina marina]|uniref:RNA helicase n=1 Tax=Calycina marina TaxID=1763456 RepID=A0A9P7ZBP2_9HELO|nr:P-loop containing nucleoside triphosphate hydrolase protein [Calycina marina]